MRGLLSTFRIYNSYIHYVDYFLYLRSFPHKHQSRGVGGVLEVQYVLEDEVLSGACERSLEDDGATFGYNYFHYANLWSLVR